VKARYIDPAPFGYQVIHENGLDRVYIPARVQDNHALMRSDPTYVDKLRMSGSPELVRAWLDGDWSVIAGAFFPEFSTERHVIAPITLPAHWMRYRAADWGSAKPFSIGWYAVSDGSMPEFPRGALIKYREWYGMQPGQPNVGLKMTAEEVADGIKERERSEKLTLSVIDPAAFTADGGPSIAERMGARGVHFSRADNKRIATSGAIGGWDQLRARLKGDDKPMLYLFSTCVHTIRTLPALQHDEHRPEDVDTDSEDHAADETRYACMARPWVKDNPQGKSITDYRFGADMTFNELRDSVRRRRREAA
jgi:hypothetical protein